MLPQKKYFKQKKYLILRRGSLKIIFILILISALIYYLLKGNFFRIKKINCQINQTNCHEEIKAKFSSFLNQNILLANFVDVITSLKKEYPHWQDLKVSKKLPDLVLVEIKTSQPVAILRENKEGSLEFYLVDRHGILLGKRQKNPGLPLILLEEIGSPALNTQIESTSLSSALELIDFLKDYRWDFKHILIKGEAILLQFDDFQAIFSPKDDLQKQVTSLQLIINEGRIRNQNPKSVDLRFEKPVITY